MMASPTDMGVLILDVMLVSVLGMAHVYSGCDAGICFRYGTCLFWM